jgi:hypothetical protein
MVAAAMAAPAGAAGVRYIRIMSRLAVAVSFAMACAATEPPVTRAGPAASLVPAEGVFRVTCRVPNDAAGRAWVLEPTGEKWRLVFTSTETKTSPVQLALPNARPTVTATSVRLSYRNANGGRQVDLSVGEGPARLDVWVDHGLEVNIEPDLDPRVDLMTTHGLLDNVRCDVTPVAP